MLLTHLVLFSFLGGASASDAAPVAAETPSGGWRPGPLSRRPWPREESDEAREARIKAERVRMGILPPDDINSDTTGDMKAAPALATTLSTVGTGSGAESVRSSTYSLAAHLLPEDLAGLEALAARAAQLSIDEEITAWLGLQRLEEQRRLYERDEDDAAVLMLAIATIH